MIELPHYRCLGEEITSCLLRWARFQCFDCNINVLDKVWWDFQPTTANIPEFATTLYEWKFYFDWSLVIYSTFVASISPQVLSLYSKTYQWSLRWWCSWHQFLGQILVSPNSDLHRCVDRHKTGLCQIMVLSLENCDVDDNSHHSLFNSFCFIWFERFVNICVTMRVHIYHIKAYYPSIQWILRTKSICCFNHAHAIFWIDKKKKLFEAKTKIRNVS